MIITDIVLKYVELARAAMSFYLRHTGDILDGLHIFFDSTFKVGLLIAMFLSITFVVIILLTTIFRRKTKNYEFIRSQAPTVTIQIPTRNEIVAINCAENCLNFDYPEDKFDILLGDDSDDPAVSKALDEFASKHQKVRVIRRKHNIGFKPGNLNNMLKHTAGEILVIFDSDYLPKEDFLKRLIAPFQHDKELAGTQARWKPINCDTNLTTMFGAALTEVFHQIFVPFMYKFTPTVNFCGSAEAVKKSTLIKLGGWKTGSFTEDIEYTMRVYKSGYRIQYIHDLPCEMEVPYNAKDLCKQQMRWAFGVIYAIKEHWWDIMKAKISWRTKMNIFVHASGYCLSSLIFFLFLFGSLSFITHPPGPIDLSLFIKETITNIVLTSGFLITLAVALVRSGRWKKIFAAIPTALSLGLLVTFYVNKGIIKVFTDKKMDWYLMKKTGRQGA